MSGVKCCLIWRWGFQEDYFSFLFIRVPEKKKKILLEYFFPPPLLWCHFVDETLPKSELLPAAFIHKKTSVVFSVVGICAHPSHDDSTLYLRWVAGSGRWKTILKINATILCIFLADYLICHTLFFDAIGLPCLLNFFGLF